MVEGQSVSPKGKNSLCWRAQGGIGKPRLESVFSRALPDMDASVHERMLVTSSHERLHGAMTVILGCGLDSGEDGSITEAMDILIDPTKINE